MNIYGEEQPSTRAIVSIAARVGPDIHRLTNEEIDDLAREIVLLQKFRDGGTRVGGWGDRVATSDLPRLAADQHGKRHRPGDYRARVL